MRVGSLVRISSYVLYSKFIYPIWEWVCLDTSMWESTVFVGICLHLLCLVLYSL